MIDDTKGFAQNSIMFLTKCNKPDRKGIIYSQNYVL
jgi:hypothetical protein